MCRLQPDLYALRCERLVRARAGTCPELHFGVSNPRCKVQSGRSVLQNRSCWCADSSPGMLPRVSTAWTVPDLRAERDGVHPTMGPRRRLSEKPQERKWDLAWPLGGKSLTSNPSPEAHAAGETSWFCSLDGWGLRPSWAQVWPLPPPKKKTAAPAPALCRELTAQGYKLQEVTTASPGTFPEEFKIKAGGFETEQDRTWKNPEYSVSMLRASSRGRVRSDSKT